MWSYIIYIQAHHKVINIERKLDMLYKEVEYLSTGQDIKEIAIENIEVATEDIYELIQLNKKYDGFPFLYHLY